MKKRKLYKHDIAKKEYMQQCWNYFIVRKWSKYSRNGKKNLSMIIQQHNRHMKIAWEKKVVFNFMKENIACN